MARFVVDEDMPRSTAVALRQAGHDAEDVRDVGPRGHSDNEVYAYAQTRGATLITADKDFADIQRFPLGSHAGIIVLRTPNALPVDRENQALISALSELSEETLNGILVIVEIGRIRVRRPPRSGSS